MWGRDDKRWESGERIEEREGSWGVCGYMRVESEEVEGGEEVFMIVEEIVKGRKWMDKEKG